MTQLIAPYSQVASIKRDVNVRDYNKQVIARKLRIAKFVSAPILRKTSKITRNS